MDRSNQNISKSTLVALLGKALSNGVTGVRKRYQIQADIIRKATAYRIYGRTNVDRWIKENLIKIHLDHVEGVALSRSELMKIAESSNRITYLPVNSRRK